MTDIVHDPAEIKALRENLAAREPAWNLFHRETDGLLRATRAGTLLYEQASFSPEGIAAEVNACEARIASN